MKILLNIVVALTILNATVCLGEVAESKVEKNSPAANGPTWAGLNLAGLTLDLRSDTDVLWMLFNTEGYVSVSLGKKGGPVTAPAYRWKISGEWMQLLDDSGKVWFQMRVLKKTDKMLLVENQDGEKQTFAIKKR